jgi:hypothetical protein
VLQSIVVGFGALDDRESLSYCWLYPFRDLLGFVLWIVSFTGRTIVWRGERYEMLPGGRIRPLNERTPAKLTAHAASARASE